MTALTWNEAVPSGTSIVAQAPAFWRSLQTSIAVGLSTDLYWDGSGGASFGSRGLLQPGASRVYYGPGSASSNSLDAFIVGRAFLTSNSSNLQLYESNGTFRLGGYGVAEYRNSGNSIAQSGSSDLQHTFYREVSGFTVATNISTAGVRAVGLWSGDGDMQCTTVTCSERSVLFNVQGYPTFSRSGTVFYFGLTNSPSTATFNWTAIWRSADTNL